MCSICGSTDGGKSKRRAGCISFATPMISSSACKSNTMPTRYGPHWTNAYEHLGCSSIRTKPGCCNLDVTHGKDRERQGLAKPGTFGFLGCTHIASVNRAGTHFQRR